MATDKKHPTGDGTDLQWQNGGWADVDEVVADDNDYIDTTESYKKHGLDFDAFSISSSAIANVTITMRAHTPGGDDSAGLIIAMLVNGSTYYEGGYQDVTTVATDYEAVWTQNPDTGPANWTDADVNRTGSNNLTEMVPQSGDIASQLRATQVFIEVNYTPSSVDLSINVSDSINAVENIGENLPLAGISKFDQLTVQEIVTLLLSILPEGVDNVTVQEVVSAIMSGLAASPFDIVNISESVSTILDKHNVSSSDVIEVVENISVLLPLAGLSVSDVVNVIQDVTVIVSIASLSMLVSDNIELSQLISVVMLLSTIVPFDSIKISEYVDLVVTAVVDLSISAVFDQITLAESIAAAMSGLASAPFDNIQVSESLNFIFSVGAVSSFDSLFVAENIAVSLSSVSDWVKIVLQGVINGNFVNLSGRYKLG